MIRDSMTTAWHDGKFEYTLFSDGFGWILSACPLDTGDKWEWFLQGGTTSEAKEDALQLIKEWHNDSTTNS